MENEFVRKGGQVCRAVCSHVVDRSLVLILVWQEGREGEPMPFSTCSSPSHTHTDLRAASFEDGDTAAIRTLKVRKEKR